MHINIQLWITPDAILPPFSSRASHHPAPPPSRVADGLPPGFGHHFHMADDARLHHRHYVVRIAHAGHLLPSVLSHTPASVAQRYRLSGALLICGLMLVVSLWCTATISCGSIPRIRLLFGAAIVLSGIVLYRLRYYRYPTSRLGLFTRRNVVPILLVTFFAELGFQC